MKVELFHSENLPENFRKFFFWIFNLTQPQYIFEICIQFFSCNFLVSHEKWFVDWFLVDGHSSNSRNSYNYAKMHCVCLYFLYTIFYCDLKFVRCLTCIAIIYLRIKPRRQELILILIYFDSTVTVTPIYHLLIAISSIYLERDDLDRRHALWRFLSEIFTDE